MSVASQFEPFDGDRAFYDRDTWEAVFATLLTDDPETIHAMALLLCEILTQLELGKEGKARVISTLKLGLQVIYQYTDLYRLSFLAFLYRLEGLIAGDDSLESRLTALISDANRKSGLG